MRLILSQKDSKNGLFLPFFVVFEHIFVNFPAEKAHFPAKSRTKSNEKDKNSEQQDYKRNR
jgi:hypothetical protein